MLFATVIGVNAGIISAWKQNTWFDFLAMVFALIGVSIPVFWLALMEQWEFAQELGWFPAYGRQSRKNPVDTITNLHVMDTIIRMDYKQLSATLKHLVLPSIALGTIPIANISRMTHCTLLEGHNPN